MALLESLILNLSPAIAKVLLKVWLKDHMVELDTSTGIVDALKSITSDALGRKTVDRQLQAISDKVAVALEATITARGKDLTDEGRETVADAMVAALRVVKIDATSLISLDLAPKNLEIAILAARPTDAQHLTSEERDLFEFVAADLSEYIIDIAGNFPSSLSGQ